MYKALLGGKGRAELMCGRGDEDLTFPNIPILGEWQNRAATTFEM